MPRGSQKTTARISGPAKAGKRRAPFQYPPEPSPERTAAREAGDQQFVLHRSARVEVANLLGRIEAVTVPFAWCPHRKHVLFSPGRNEAKR